MVRFGQGGSGASDPTSASGHLGITTMTLRDLMINKGYEAPTLLETHVLMLVNAGHGTHEVDFVSHDCRPGTLIWTRPGQLVRFGGQQGLDASLICWGNDLLAPLHPQAVALDGPVGTISWQLAGEDEDAVINEVSQLVVDCQRHRSGDLAAVLLRHQLAGLLLRISLMVRETGAETGADIFRRFRAEVENGHPHSRRVDDYAASLGCCVRTLTRACLTATGRSAKQVIDDRVALQATRLLAGTDLSVAEIGRRLGFPEPTNFGRFFQREVGRSPGSFRAEVSPRRRAPLPSPRRSLDMISPLGLATRHGQA